MALTGKKYEPFYVTTGSGSDKASSDNLTKAEALWDLEKAEGSKYLLTHPDFGPIVYQLQQMQDEIDYLRTEISANKDKTGITSSQASAITANTAKTSFPGLGTTSSTALAGDTKIISLGSSTTYAFSDLINNRGIFTIRLTATSSGVTKVLDLRLV